MATFKQRPQPFTVRPARAINSQALDFEPQVFEAGGEGDWAWLDSSLELSRGMQVSEQPLDSLPIELQRAFLRR